jgi:hypothetical protein
MRMAARSSSLKKKKVASNNRQASSPEDRLRYAKIARLFQSRRIAAGLDQAKAAAELGLPSTALLEDYESGKKAIPLDEIFALTNILNIPPEEVMDLVQELFNCNGAL